MPTRRVGRGSIQDAYHLLGAEHIGQVAAGLRRVEQGGDVAVGQLLAQRKAVEAADGGHLARLGARPAPLAAQRVHEIAHRLGVVSPRSSGDGRELRQVAAVGRDRERREPPLDAQLQQKGVDRLRERCASHLPRS